MTEDWKYLSKFIEWVDSQPNKDWQNCEPDKDFLSEGNKHYSPETVVFISKKLNLFTSSKKKNRGKYMIGVSLYRYNNVDKYTAQCSNPLLRSSFFIGIYDTELEAHKAWQAKKHEYACMLADLQEDQRIASRLREMYAPDKDWTKA